MSGLSARELPQQINSEALAFPVRGFASEIFRHQRMGCAAFRFTPRLSIYGTMTSLFDSRKTCHETYGTSHAFWVQCYKTRTKLLDKCSACLVHSRCKHWLLCCLPTLGQRVFMGRFSLCRGASPIILKSHLSYVVQVARLSERGLTYANHDNVHDVLTTVGYYRFSAYTYPF